MGRCNCNIFQGDAESEMVMVSMSVSHHDH